MNGTHASPETSGNPDAPGRPDVSGRAGAPGDPAAPGRASESSRADSHKDAILDAAAFVFAENGFAGARVEAIARAAGINKAMLYYRVGDKARLYELVVLRQFGRVARAVEDAAARPGDPAGTLARVLQALAALFEEDPKLPRIMAWELASGGRNLPAQVLTAWGRILGAVSPALAGAGLDPILAYLSLLAPMVFTSLTGPVRKRLGAGAPPPLGRVASVGVADMAAFLSGLFARAARPDPPREDS